MSKFEMKQVLVSSFIPRGDTLAKAVKNCYQINIKIVRSCSIFLCLFNLLQIFDCSCGAALKFIFCYNVNQAKLIFITQVWLKKIPIGTFEVQFSI